MEIVNQYYYTAFGLTIVSEIPVPEFMPLNAECESFDLRIQLGSTPLSLPEPAFSGVNFSCAPGKFFLHINKIADFLSEKGALITIQPAQDAAPEDIRLFLLGSVFGALLHQRGALVIHGSAIEKNGNAAIFSGLSGSGKSTLAAAWVEKGWNLITDDVCAIFPDPLKGPVIHSGYPQLKLWDDALKKLGKNPDNYKSVRSHLSKFAVQKRDQFAPDAYPVHSVFCLQTKNSDGSTLEEVKGLEKFSLIRNNTYRFQFIEGLGMTQRHFELSGFMAGKIKVFRLTRTQKEFCVDDLIRLTEPFIQTAEKNGNS